MNACLLSIRIVTYNVLSSHLADPARFTACNPQHLKASNRLPKILQKIDAEIKQMHNADEQSTSSASETRPIFCLQEVSHEWAGKFHTFFAQRNYHFITGLYGKRYDGYMGVGLAFPLDAYEPLDITLERLSDKRAVGWPPREEAAGMITKLLRDGYTFVSGGVQSFLVKPAKRVLGWEEQSSVDHWQMSENRYNMLLFARLRVREETALKSRENDSPESNDAQVERTFCVGTYHMPCAFYAPMVMTIHTDLVCRRVQDLAASHPYVLAGDFNILPSSSTYKLVMTGELDRNDPSYPSEKNGMEWSPSLRPMRSAYAVSEHGEPDFTNYAKV